jgi:holo-[acyl-carrier protein] synthase
MGIAGLGHDLVEIAAFASLLDEPGTVFAQQVFTDGERQAAAQRAARGSGRPAVHLAARYAAKEACLKALSQALAPTPLPRQTADLREIEVVSDSDGRPSLALAGHLRVLALRAGVSALHVSLTHDGAYASAVVLAER